MIIDYTARLKEMTKNKSAINKPIKLYPKQDTPIQDTQTKLKVYYNELVVKYNKAEQYMDDNSISVEQREKYIPEFKQIMRQMSEMLDVIDNYTDQEILNGFILNTQINRTS